MIEPKDAARDQDRGMNKSAFARITSIAARSGRESSAQFIEEEVGIHRDSADGMCSSG